MRTWVQTRHGVVACVLAILAVFGGTTGAQAAAPAWTPPEVAPNAKRAFLGPDGFGFVVGRNAANSGIGIATRPVGGPLGAFEALPMFSANTFDSISVSFDSTGNALVTNHSSGRISYRPVGAASTYGSPQVLGSAAYRPASISMAPTGEAFVGMGGAPNTVRVGFRAAGAAALVDTAGAQDFVTVSGSVIGVVLDPAGSGIVVFTSSGSLFQAVRPLGALAFNPPTEITTPGPNPTKYQVVMSADPSGNAVLSWSGSSAAGQYAERDRAVASFRGPGGEFAPPTIVGASAPGMYGGISSVVGATNAQGHALVAWTQATSTDICPSHQGDVSDNGAFAANYGGGGWGSPVALGASTFPETSSIEAVRGAGSSLVTVINRQHEGTVRCEAAGLIDNHSDIQVRAAIADQDGFRFTTDHLLAASYAREDGQFVHPQFHDLAINAGGNMLSVYDLYPNRLVSAYEEPRNGAETPDPGQPAGGGADPLQPAPPIVAIRPTQMMAPQPINISKPSLTGACPMAADTECSFKVNVYMWFGANPSGRGVASRGKKPKPILMGSINTKLAAGTTRELKLKLTKAGKAAIKANVARKLRLEITTTVNGTTVTRTATVKLVPRPTPKRRGGK